MSERFANAFSTTLTAAIDTVATSIAVATAAPAALQGGEFRILVGGGELMLVTATGSSGASPWTVQRAAEVPSVAMSHASGATVEHVLTAASLSEAVESSNVGGDLTGTTAAATVAKVKGKTVPTPGAGQDGMTWVYDHASGAMVWTAFPSGLPASPTDGQILGVTGTTPTWKTPSAVVAADIPSTATGDVAATNVQAAIAELASEKIATSARGAANGVAPLGAGSLVPVANLGSGTPTGSKYLRDDGTFAALPAATSYAPAAEIAWRSSDIIAANHPRRMVFGFTNGGIASGKLMYAGGFVIPAGLTVNGIRMWANGSSSVLTHSWAALVNQAGTVLGKSSDITSEFTVAAFPAQSTSRTWTLTSGVAAGGSDLAVAVLFCFDYTTGPPSLQYVSSSAGATAQSPLLAGYVGTGFTGGPSALGGSITTPTSANALGQFYYAELI